MGMLSIYWQQGDKDPTVSLHIIKVPCTSETTVRVLQEEPEAEVQPTSRVVAVSKEDQEDLLTSAVQEVAQQEPTQTGLTEIHPSVQMLLLVGQEAEAVEKVVMEEKSSMAIRREITELFPEEVPADASPILTHHQDRTMTAEMAETEEYILITPLAVLFPRNLL